MRRHCKSILMWPSTTCHMHSNVRTLVMRQSHGRLCLHISHVFIYVDGLIIFWYIQMPLIKRIKKDFNSFKVIHLMYALSFRRQYEDVHCSSNASYSTHSQPTHNVLWCSDTLLRLTFPANRRESSSLWIIFFRIAIFWIAIHSKKLYIWVKIWFLYSATGVIDSNEAGQSAYCCVPVSVFQIVHYLWRPKPTSWSQLRAGDAFVQLRPRT